MKRRLSKSLIVGLLFAAALLGVMLYETLRLRQVECEVCVELDGRTKCLIVRGEDEQQAIQTARDGACSFITAGRAEVIRCSGKPPTSYRCKPL